MHNRPPPSLTPSLDDNRLPGVFWRPNAAFLSELTQYLGGNKVLEIFAGNGYLAGLLSQQGVHVTATSILSGMDCHARGVYHPVENIGAVEAVQKHGEGHDILLICWPTTTLDVLRAALLWGTERPIVYIGEFTDLAKQQLGGCATDEFFESIEVVKRFEHYQGNMYEAAWVCRLKPL